MRTCRSCFASIVWASTSSGKPIPLDPGTSPEGNISLRGGVALVFTGDKLAEVREREGGRLYTSHFATCPNASAHRR